MAAKKAATKGRKTQPRKKASAPVRSKKVSSAVKVAKSAKLARAKTTPPTKPIKYTSGLKKADLDHFRQLLLERRREILSDVGSMENEAFKAGSNLSNMPIHMADVGTDNFEQEFTLGLIESERLTLREIQEALGRIEDGTYGLCVATGKPIGRMRLEAVPWAKHTIEYSRMLEQGLVHREADQRQEEEGAVAGGEEEEE
jgi:DnaK suppressor protein